MKLKLTLFCPIIFSLLLPLYAENSTTKDSAAETEVEEKELPEVSDPPYSIGDRATIQGHYIPLDDDISLNFRFLGNRMRVYWVDADGLIVEPRAAAGNVRFLASVRGPIYFSMGSLEDEDGLGSLGGPVYAPHLFTVILSLEKADSEEFDVYTFRYSQAMDTTRETRELVIEEENEDRKSARRKRY